ncbi:DNA-directed RNA polymerase III subunit rpc25 [Rhizophlyctis rosea]|nr:DNA-directed RNA polymerase III subunit rpc25 [Rhizophlyctis rosea]
MFILSHLRDNVRVHPRDFRKPRAQALTDELNKKYANKILHNVGLCIRVFDLLDASEGVVHACQDGSYQCKVSFRMIVFRPFVGEILVGKVAGSSATEGIKVSLEFFEDISIPPTYLPANTEFDSAEGLWVWKYDENELYIEKDSLIRFRIEQEAFFDVGPVRENLPEGSSGGETGGKVAYSIYGSIDDSGLGSIEWWE